MKYIKTFTPSNDDGPREVIKWLWRLANGYHTDESFTLGPGGHFPFNEDEKKALYKLTTSKKLRVMITIEISDA
jgi:hypothetical protein